MAKQPVVQHECPAGAANELADVADALEILASQVRLDRLRVGATNARTLVQAALLHAEQAPPLLSLAMRFLREFEKAAGEGPLSADAQRLHHRLGLFLGSH